MQILNATQNHLQRHKKKEETVAVHQRKAENRTKIQLGGLILKSGLANLLDILPGADLQLDEDEREKAAILLGALLEIVGTINQENAEEQKQLWAYKGLKAMGVRK